MSEDSIHVLIVKVEQYFLCSKRKRLRKKNHVYLCIIHIRKFWGAEQKTIIALIYFPLIDAFLADVPFSAAHIG